jgi:hypothetical protein
MKKTETRSLLERIESARAPDQQLNEDIWRWYCRIAVGDSLPLDTGAAQNFTGSLEAAIDLVKRVLPGWWWRVCECWISDDAWIAPDYNSPEHRERLRRQFPVDACKEFETEFDVDRRPPGNLALALCQSLFMACAKIEDLGLDLRVSPGADLTVMRNQSYPTATLIFPATRTTRVLARLLTSFRILS